MVFVALCDDQNEYLDYEEKVIYNCFNSKGVECSVTKFCSGKDLIKSDFNRFDMIFLDMDMPEMDGIDVAKTLRKSDFSGKIVFVTVIINKVTSGYIVGAYRYIIKNAKNQISFMECINSFLIEKDKLEKIIKIQTKDGEVDFFTGRIIYIESQKHYLYFHLYEKGKIEMLKIRGKLEDWEYLSKYNMIRIHRGIILNLEYVEKIKRYSAELKYSLGSIMIGQPRYKYTYIQYLKYKGGCEVE